MGIARDQGFAGLYALVRPLYHHRPAGYLHFFYQHPPQRDKIPENETGRPVLTVYVDLPRIPYIAAQ
jgi:hypothetical protein